MSEEQRRVVTAAVIGAPNAGKSTLVNRLVGAKISIVTHKVQTTRMPVRGVAIHGAVQIILVDTPGVFQPRRRLDRAMVHAAWSHAADADIVVHLVDAAAQARTLGKAGSGADRAAAEDVERILAGLQRAGRTALLALNKVDAMPRPALLQVAATLFDTGCYSEVFMISALGGDGVEVLREAIARAATPSPWLYPEDQIADAPMRSLAAEITREALMLRLHEEIPYAATVETERFEERADGSVRIEQLIFVERESQRRIAIGAKAATLKAIGQAARAELVALLERPVHLFLHVKVREGWAEERARLTSLGLQDQG